MSFLHDSLGVRILEGVLYTSYIGLLYFTAANLVIPGLILFAVICASYWNIRHYGAPKVPTKGKYILITGCDTGFGNSLARLMDSNGLNVFATCQSESSEGAKKLMKKGSRRMRVLPLDVTSDESLASCLQIVQTECSEEGTGLWALVNNAGIISPGDLEVQTIGNYKKVSEVNLFGMVRVCKAFLPLIRKRKGRVINVTGVRGLLGFHSESTDVMSKFGAEGFTDCLRLEMRRFGVKVIHIQPGMYETYTALYSLKNKERYQASYQRLVDSVSDDLRRTYGDEYLETMFNLPSMRLDVSDKYLTGVLTALEDAVLSRNPHCRYLVGFQDRWLDTDCLMARLKYFLPPPIMDHIYFSLHPLPKEAFMNSKIK